MLNDYPFRLWKRVSESDISSFIPETITTYKLNGQLYSQEIKDINIVRRQTEGKSDFIECEIRLEDENLERTVYADLYLTKYDTGEWILDNWSPYASEDYTNKTKTGSEIMDEALEESWIMNWQMMELKTYPL